jgi:RNA polymerase sigma-70 factor (ECF subfamily)
MNKIIDLFKLKTGRLQSDGALVERARSGDAQAFRILYERHSEVAARAAARILGDGGQVEDVVQETFIKAHGALDRFDTSRPFAPWVARIARNAAVSRLRKRRDAIDLAQVRHLRGVDEWERLAARERLAAFRAALARLSPDAREAIMLHDVEGLTLAEIAEAKDTSINTIASRVRRARQKLAELMEPAASRTQTAGGAS